MDVYIVRIYRRRKNSARVLVGVVETIGVKGRQAFTTFDELREILNTRRKPASERAKKGGEV